jgi:hypothetical protein
VQPLSAGVDRFSNHARTLQRCCVRVEEQFDRPGSRLRVSDVELVYTSSFLGIVSRWESFLEDALLETVCGPATRMLKERRLVQIARRQHFREILLHPNLDYLSLPTVKKAHEVYSLYLIDGGPFAEISEQNRTYLQQATWIRNAIAHASDHAREIFKTKVPGVEALPANRRKPGPFLRHQFRQAPEQTRFELYVAALIGAARQMDNSWSG